MAYVTKPALVPSDFGFPPAATSSDASKENLPVKEKLPKKKKPKKKIKKPAKSQTSVKPKSNQKKRKLPWKT